MHRAALRLVPILAIFFLALHPQIGRSASPNPCGGDDDRGMGGTGLADDRGVGGTGLGSDRGMGGTGAQDEGGAGGTGFFGTLTGFGSVCVNGQPIRYDAGTRVERDGAPRSVSSLRAGQTVVVDAVQDGAGFRAARIEVQPAVTGTVTRVDSAAQRLEVLLQVVDASRAVQRFSGLSLSDARPGDRIAVHGLRDVDGNIRATRIERASADAPASVSGRLRELPDGGHAIGRLRVAGDVGGPSVASPARVTGSWVAANGELADARSRPALDFAPGTRQASLEAWVAARDGSQLATSLLTIETARAAVVPARPDAGSRVWAFGSLTPSGTLDARFVEVDAVGGGALVPPDWDDDVPDRSGEAHSDGDDADDAEDVDDADDAEDEDVDDADDAEDEDVDDADDADDVDDVDDIDDGDDGGEPDIDDGELPDIDDDDLPDIDDDDLPDLNDVDIPDIDDAADGS